MFSFDLVNSYILEIKVFSVVFCTLLASFFSRKILNAVKRRALKTKSIWDDSIIYAFEKPVRILILVFGFSYVFQILTNAYNLQIESTIHSVRTIFVIFSITFFVLRFLKKSESIYIEQHELNKEKLTTINAVVKLLKISVIITSILILMQTLGINISGVLAFGGVSGIAVGFAAKDLLSNFFGALMIYLDKPFRIGDWVSSPDRDIEGVVESIGWRQTRIRSFDKRPIYVPNSVFSTITVHNPSRMTHRRIVERVGVRYDDFNKLDKVIIDIREYLKKHDDVDQDEMLVVNFDKYADSALEIKIICLISETSGTEFARIKEEILISIGKIIEKHKAEMAYPTRTLHLNNSAT